MTPLAGSRISRRGFPKGGAAARSLSIALPALRRAGADADDLAHRLRDAFTAPVLRKDADANGSYDVAKALEIGRRMQDETGLSPRGEAGREMSIGCGRPPARVLACGALTRPREKRLRSHR